MMNANQAKADANLKELKEDIKTNQAKTDINLNEMRKEIKSRQAEMRSIINA
jgi:translation elongation factor EF-1beta